MEMEWLNFGFQVLQFLLTGAVAFYVYLSNKDKVTNNRISKLQDDLDDKMDGHVERIAKLEVRAESALTHDDLSELHDKINRVGGDVKILTGEFSGVRNLLGTIHNHLLNGGKQ